MTFAISRGLGLSIEPAILIAAAVWPSQSGGDDQDVARGGALVVVGRPQVSIVEAVVYLSEKIMCVYKSHHARILTK